MTGKPHFITVQMTKWPEHKLPWKHVRAEALKKNTTITQYVLEAIMQRIKGGW